MQHICELVHWQTPAIAVPPSPPPRRAAETVPPGPRRTGTLPEPLTAQSICQAAAFEPGWAESAAVQLAERFRITSSTRRARPYAAPVPDTHDWWISAVQYALCRLDDASKPSSRKPSWAPFIQPAAQAPRAAVLFCLTFSAATASGRRPCCAHSA